MMNLRQLHGWAQEAIEILREIRDLLKARTAER